MQSPPWKLGGLFVLNNIAIANLKYAFVSIITFYIFDMNSFYTF